jgi:diacylglycerol kinase (ATP)
MPRRTIDEVVIIYNPNSTGDSDRNAKQLRAELKEHAYDKKVRLLPTKYRGHAEKIALSYGKKDQLTLLVSSSGDGGYHELINGVLNSRSGNLIVGLLPSGNANDHFSALGTESVVDDIIKQKVTLVDVLKVEATVNGNPWVRYAHSYVGIGVSPVIGRELNKLKLNFFNEKVILVKQLLSFNSIGIRVNGKMVRIISLIFANIPTMSKVLTVAQKSAVNDGKFEVNMIKAGTKLQLFASLFQASTIGLKEDRSTKNYTFQTRKKTPIQLDGEVYTLDGDCTVTVTAVTKALKEII